MTDRPKLLAVVFLVGAFLAGGSLGLAADHVVGARLGGRPPTMLDEFAADLDLTPGQRAAVDSILDERHRIIDSIVAPVRPQIEAAKASARGLIKQRLTPAQQLKFDAYLERTRREREAAERGRDAR